MVSVATPSTTDDSLSPNKGILKKGSKVRYSTKKCDNNSTKTVDKTIKFAD